MFQANLYLTRKHFLVFITCITDERNWRYLERLSLRCCFFTSSKVISNIHIVLTTFSCIKLPKDKLIYICIYFILKFHHLIPMISFPWLCAKTPNISLCSSGHAWFSDFLVTSQRFTPKAWRLFLRNGTRSRTGVSQRCCLCKLMINGEPTTRGRSQMAPWRWLVKRGDHADSNPMNPLWQHPVPPLHLSNCSHSRAWPTVAVGADFELW